MKTAILNNIDLSGKKAYYATFGRAHALPDGYFKIWARDETAARALMYKWFSHKWGAIYDNETGAGINQFHLKKVREVIFG